LTTVSANYIDAIVQAIEKAQRDGRPLEVTILTSDPANPFIDPRADQLEEDRAGYRDELQGSLRSIAAKLRRFPNCRILTYRDFPVQLWHRIDSTIYVGNSSLIRRTRHNCAFAVSVDVPGVKETFLEHFVRLQERATPYTAVSETTEANSVVGASDHPIDGGEQSPQESSSVTPTLPLRRTRGMSKAHPPHRPRH